MNKHRFVTILTFHTTSEKIKIDDAMLALYPKAAWLESNQQSTFKSNSLCDAILESYFENVESVKSNIAHKFDVYSEGELQLIIHSEIQPKFRRIDPYEALPYAQFAIISYAQDLLSDWGL